MLKKLAEVDIRTHDRIISLIMKVLGNQITNIGLQNIYTAMLVR